MNNLLTLGSAIKKVRTEKQLTQFQLSKLTNMSRTTITMFESGERQPSTEHLVLLSNKLDFDFVTLTNKISNFKNFDHYLLANNLVKHINHGSIEDIKKVFDSSTIINEFTYGEPLVIKTYCETLLLIQVHNDIEAAYQKCVEFFKIDMDSISNFHLKIDMPSHYYAMFFTLSHYLYKEQEWDKLISLYKIMLDFLERNYFNNNINFTNIDRFYKKHYIVCLNNLSEIYFLSKDFKKALHFCNKGIEASREMNKLNVLPFLTKVKVEVLYCSGEVDEAKESYTDFKSFCRVTNNLDYFEESTKIFKDKYTGLFELNFRFL